MLDERSFVGRAQGVPSVRFRELHRAHSAVVYVCRRHASVFADGRELELRLDAGALDQSGKSPVANGDPALRQTRTRCCLTFKLGSARISSPMSGCTVPARNVVLDPPHTRRVLSRSTVDLAPAQVDELSRAQAMSVGHQDHDCVSVTVPIVRSIRLS